MTLHAVVKPGNPALPWIVWLHGFLGSAADWQEIAPAFNHPQLLVDLPGHGGSCGIPPANFSSTHRQLENTLLNYNILNYWLVGYSLGGRVAMSHACRQPRGLQGLIVEGSHPGLTTYRERQARRDSDARWVRRFTSEPLEYVLQDWYAQPVFASLSPARRQAFIDQRRDNHAPALATMLHATSLGRQPNLRPYLARLPVAFHFLHGAGDTRFQAIAQDIPAQRHAIPDAGHNAHRENPQAFCACLATILSHSIEDAP
ncbi:2-succinyl-6-hydroxy-2,4-cyclohexadiene-1-carboxylate synthase [Siccibacter colletis]|uniref:2-succinyl-6-hydroxy-2, 4-cyclohexadiene-1-carboxylate synthase n=1 Tax=Siccibacter colletis TaxID=1505757 RepID=UPI003CED8151